MATFCFTEQLMKRGLSLVQAILIGIIKILVMVVIICSWIML